MTDVETINDELLELQENDDNAEAAPGSVNLRRGTKSRQSTASRMTTDKVESEVDQFVVGRACFVNKWNVVSSSPFLVVNWLISPSHASEK